jgi:uncharacterized protein YndB with AHSA1/START domain
MLKKIGIVCLVVVLAFLGIGLLLPGEYDVARSGRVDAPPDEVWATVATLETWPEWSAWNQAKDPSAEFSFSGEKTGVGAVWNWTGEEFGVGEMTLIAAVPSETVVYQIEMEGMDMEIVGHITLEAADGGTEVTFRGQGDLGTNPVFRWMGLAMDGMLGSDYDECIGGLQRLHNAP